MKPLAAAHVFVGVLLLQGCSSAADEEHRRLEQAKSLASFPSACRDSTRATHSTMDLPGDRLAEFFKLSIDAACKRDWLAVLRKREDVHCPETRNTVFSHEDGMEICEFFALGKDEWQGKSLQIMVSFRHESWAELAVVTEK